MTRMSHTRELEARLLAPYVHSRAPRFPEVLSALTNAVRSTDSPYFIAPSVQVAVRGPATMRSVINVAVDATTLARTIRALRGLGLKPIISGVQARELRQFRHPRERVDVNLWLGRDTEAKPHLDRPGVAGCFRSPEWRRIFGVSLPTAYAATLLFMQPQAFHDRTSLVIGGRRDGTPRRQRLKMTRMARVVGKSSTKGGREYVMFG